MSRGGGCGRAWEIESIGKKRAFFKTSLAGEAVREVWAKGLRKMYGAEWGGGEGRSWIEEGGWKSEERRGVVEGGGTLGANKLYKKIPAQISTCSLCRRSLKALAQVSLCV